MLLLQDANWKDVFIRIFSLMVVILIIKLMIQSDQDPSNLDCFNLYFYFNIFKSPIQYINTCS